MYKEKRILFLIAETSLHPGSRSELGIVDLPIQRERYTDFPKIESSGLKGCIREAFEGYRIFENKKSKLIDSEKTKVLKDKFPLIDQPWKIKNEQGQDITLIKFDEAIYLIFGPEGTEESRAGCMSITDARILLFPVKSLKGVFTWITCPLVLERFVRDLEIANIEIRTSHNIQNTTFSNLEGTIPNQTNISISDKVVLEEFTFKVRKDDTTTEIAELLAKIIFPDQNVYNFWREKLKKDLVILSDDDFKQFVKTSTEVITRTRIDNITGTVASGALWTEEYLPQDTIMYSLVMFTQPRVEKDEEKGIFKADNPQEEARKVTEFFEIALPEVIQIGGNQTIGKGFVRVKIYQGQNKEASHGRE